MANSLPAPIFFHGPGLIAELHAAPVDRCLLKITQTAPIAGAYRLEVLLSSVDARGLSSGFCSALMLDDLAFSTALGGAPTAFLWLPSNISFSLAQRCYYRVTATPARAA